MYTEMWFGRYMFGSCSISVTDVNCNTSNTSLNICCLFAFCVYSGIKWLYVCSSNITLMNGTSGCINPSLIFKLWCEWPEIHQPYQSHCESTSYNYNLETGLNSLFCKWKQFVLNCNNTIIAEELLFLNFPPTPSCPSVKESYSFMWCHISYWIQP